MTGSAYIYILIDPRNGAVRYVGKTINPRKRFIAHKCDDKDTHKVRWLSILKGLNKEPIMDIVEETTMDNWPDREKYWIQHYKDLGNDLTNSKDGGLGGGMMDDETKRKIRDIALSESDMRSKRATKNMSIKVRCVETGFIHESLKLLADHLDMLPASVSRAIKLGDKISDKTYEFVDYKYSRSKASKRVRRSDGKEYGSILAAADDIRTSRMYIRESIAGTRSVHGYTYSSIV